MPNPRFHAHSGWWFERLSDGSVLVQLRSNDRDDVLITEATFSDATWASIVASVSANGDNAATFRAAEALHAGDAASAAEGAE